MKTKNMTTLHLRTSIGRSPLRFAFLFIPLAFVCFALSPEARALLPAPTPDGAYRGWNTAEGQNALFNLTTGGFNTAIGGKALFGNTTGTANTAVGAFTLAANSSGYQNVAVGQGALRYNTDGFGNVAAGYQALFNNTDGFQNTANGSQALLHNTSGKENTAIGYGALSSNTTENDNTAVGYDALFANTAGGGNMAVGTAALFNNTAGSDNTALGAGAGIGVTTASNVICIGWNVAGADVSDTCFIGNIHGVTTQNNDAIPVLIDSAGQLGTASSSRRYKTDIKPISNTSESVLALKPVTFRYKIHKDATPQFGLIAEDVAEVNPDLVIYDADGKPYTVRYDAVNVMLLNEFLKEHRKVEEQNSKIEQQGATITELKSTVAQQKKDFGATIAQLTARLDEQAVQIQKVSAQLAAASPSRGRLEMDKPAPQMALNNP
jgi:hypothetical protein